MPERFSSWAPISLRVIIGVGFIYHGFVKLFTTVGHGNFVKLLNEIGLPAAGAFSWIIGALEFFGGIAVLAGAFMTIATALLLVNMLGAMFTVNLPNGFDLMHVTVLIEAGPKFGVPGLEINLLYIACLVSLLLTGAGNYSVDQFRTEKSGTVTAG